MKLTDTQLDEIEQIAKKATPGPWQVAHRSPSMGGRGWDLRREGVPGIIASAHEYADHRLSEHIATMDPAATLALIAEVKRLRIAADSLRIQRDAMIAELEKARFAIERVRDVHERCHEDGGCACGFSWPCETLRALDGKAS